MVQELFEIMLLSEELGGRELSGWGPFWGDLGEAGRGLVVGGVDVGVGVIVRLVVHLGLNK